MSEIALKKEPENFLGLKVNEEDVSMKRNTLLNALLATVVGFGLVGLAHAQNAKVGSVQIENAYTRSTVPGQMAAGGFMKIENKGAADQLISASSPVAGEVQLHEMAMEGNVVGTVFCIPTFKAPEIIIAANILTNAMPKVTTKVAALAALEAFWHKQKTPAGS